MLVKVNSIHNEDKMISITRLDIDDYGSVVPIKELELQLPPNNNSVIETLRNSQYAVITIREDLVKNSNIITSAETMTLDELNKEKQKLPQTKKIDSH